MKSEVESPSLEGFKSPVDVALGDIRDGLGSAGGRAGLSVLKGLFQLTSFQNSKAGL